MKIMKKVKVDHVQAKTRTRYLQQASLKLTLPKRVRFFRYFFSETSLIAIFQFEVRNQHDIEKSLLKKVTELYVY
jgi:hypothetical protein